MVDPKPYFETTGSLDDFWMNKFLDSQEFEQFASFVTGNDEEVIELLSSEPQEQSQGQQEQQEQQQLQTQEETEFQGDDVNIIEDLVPTNTITFEQFPNFSYEQDFTQEENEQSMESRSSPESEKKRKAQFSTPEEEMRYRKRRQRNNLAASRSREKKRLQDKENEERAKFLEEENKILKAELEKLSNQTKKFQQLLTLYFDSKR